MATAVEAARAVRIAFPPDYFEARTRMLWARSRYAPVLCHTEAQEAILRRALRALRWWAHPRAGLAIRHGVRRFYMDWRQSERKSLRRDYVCRLRSPDYFVAIDFTVRDRSPKRSTRRMQAPRRARARRRGMVGS